MISISRIDHIVLTVNSIPATIDFYVRVLGMHADTFADNRVALKFGQQKINLHQAGKEFHAGISRFMFGYRHRFNTGNKACAKL